MKMVFIIYNEAIDEEIMTTLETCCIESYTKWQRVFGKGKLSEPHLGTNVWPEANNVCMTVIDDGKVPALINKVKEMRKKLGKEGIKAFVLPLEELT